MESQIIYSLTKNFENVSYKTEEGVEFWLARDLQKLLGYSKWNNFISVIDKAKLACKNSQENISNHFAEVGKTIKMPKNASRNINDVMLTRYACYLIAQNGDSKKEEIAFAQTYFALQTRKAEIIEQKILESERVNERNKLKETEKELSKIILKQTRSNENFALIRSKGDHALFNKSTQQMKNKWKIKNKPLADFMPTILLKAKDFATEITIFNTKDKYLSSEKQISNEHITNNKTVRKTLVSRGIIPENLPPESDVNKVERKLNSDSKKSLKNKITFNNSKK
ncbi:MAG: DNA damage-inducible protein D [Candidatus Pacebacteria bacterium CG_4_10_14_3_um_filter_34_15]|nr:DNA damage-inducible protein D [Candidatus Pacearchaeota archaeon]NCQ65563.1 DNA damage-inducible protein D [Candidatus Paceibacterota bacterium]OIO44813.1 MAG: DNA damage-inducible protein D [Candidatus Pacebacteria bacterium CG1_02_43_31]PIQ81307.1 MAG: DNA damage-inducible protein D [Candidatus Pacebacteria bacterium CG11_big_fil_rev_8_21_14_0_20_34_55]PIX81134.1 MAG: DNA damage-inducible protein D [Candidatus Pacebacteria bacterium CG_4_10_14_3_um_filter_34_15]PJC43853.1 MAG: DNA damage